MPEFPLLKSQIGQVEWNGGSIFQSLILIGTVRVDVKRVKPMYDIIGSS
jgi:hypothetical protein